MAVLYLTGEGIGWQEKAYWDRIDHEPVVGDYVVCEDCGDEYPLSDPDEGYCPDCQDEQEYLEDEREYRESQR